MIDLDELEAVEGELWHPGLAAGRAAENIVVRRPGFSEVLGHQPAIGMAHFAVAKADLGAGEAFDLETHSAGEVLAQIKDLYPWRGGSDGHRLDFFDRSRAMMASISALLEATAKIIPPLRGFLRPDAKKMPLA